jgi:hypothetical protein
MIGSSYDKLLSTFGAPVNGALIITTDLNMSGSYQG